MPTAPDIKSDDYYKARATAVSCKLDKIASCYTDASVITCSGQVLGVDRGASDGEIAKAYKKLALKCSPAVADAEEL